VRCRGICGQRSDASNRIGFEKATADQLGAPGFPCSATAGR
jgi:hypothetical protein